MMENTHLRNVICFSFLTACQDSRSLKFVFYFILHNSLDSRKIVYFGNVSSEFTDFFDSLRIVNSRNILKSLQILNLRHIVNLRTITVFRNTGIPRYW